MAFNKQFGGIIDDATMNKNIGTLSYWVHRLSGIGLAIYLIMHTFVLSSAQSGAASFNERMGFVQNPFFAIMEILLIGGIFAHMLNGLRITLSDFFGWSRNHKTLFWIAVIIFFVLMILTVCLQLPKFDSGNYGMGG